jgi:hypothetical protein
VLHKWSAKIAYMENDGMVVDVQRKAARSTSATGWLRSEFWIPTIASNSSKEIIQMRPIGGGHAGW